MRYKAIENGTLSKPSYRFIEKGTYVDKSELPEGFKSKWLIPEDEARRMPVLPLTSLDKMPTQNGLDALNAMSKAMMPAHDTYTNQMEFIKRREAIEDGKAPAANAAEDLIQLPGEEQVGTGNQDVA